MPGNSEKEHVRVALHTKDGAHEYFIVAYPEALQKFRKDQGSVPLVDVVEAYHIFRGTGKGQPDQAGRAEVTGALEVESVDDAIKKIALEGEIKSTVNWRAPKLKEWY